MQASFTLTEDNIICAKYTLSTVVLIYNSVYTISIMKEYYFSYCNLASFLYFSLFSIFHTILSLLCNHISNPLLRFVLASSAVYFYSVYLSCVILAPWNNCVIRQYPRPKCYLNYSTESCTPNWFLNKTR